MDVTSDAAGRPESTVMPSLGPMPLTVIKRSNSRFSSRFRKPKSAMASSRTCVLMKSDTSAPSAGNAENVGTLMLTS